MKLLFEFRLYLHQHRIQWILKVIHKESPTVNPGFSPLEKQFYFYMFRQQRQLKSEVLLVIAHFIRSISNFFNPHDVSNFDIKRPLKHW